MLGGGAGGGRPDSIIAGMEVRDRIAAALPGFIGGMGGATAGGGGDGEFERMVVLLATGGVTAGRGFTADGLGAPKLTLEARTGTVLWKKSLEGVAPAKYEFAVATGGAGRMFMLVRRCERNGAGSERICMLVGRLKPPRPCVAVCCEALGCEVLIVMGREGMRGLCDGGVDFMRDKSGESAVVPGDGVDKSGVVVRELAAPICVPTEGKEE